MSKYAADMGVILWGESPQYLVPVTSMGFIIPDG